MGFPETRDDAIKSLVEGENKIQTICQTLRYAWREMDKMGVPKDSELRGHIVDAFIKGKMMDRELQKYDRKYWKTIFEDRR